TEVEVVEIKNIIDRIDIKIGFSNLITNLRECIRLSNAINLVYRKKISQVDLTDFILIEMLKLKNRKQYNVIRSVLMSEKKEDYLEFLDFALAPQTIYFNK